MALFYLVTFITLSVGGVAIEALIIQSHLVKLKKTNKRFPIGRYVFLLLFPFIGALVMTYFIGLPIIEIFIIFALVGTILEYVLGKSYYLIVGKHLWMYYRYNLGSYTSLLSIPLWGLAGILAYLINQVIYLK